MKNLIFILLFLSSLNAGEFSYKNFTDKYIYKTNKANQNLKYLSYQTLDRQNDYRPTIELQEKRIRIAILNPNYRKIFVFMDRADINAYKLEKVLTGSISLYDINFDLFKGESIDSKKVHIYDIDGETYLVSFYIGQHKFDGFVNKEDRHEYNTLSKFLEDTK